MVRSDLMTIMRSACSTGWLALRSTLQLGSSNRVQNRALQNRRCTAFQLTSILKSTAERFWLHRGRSRGLDALEPRKCADEHKLRSSGSQSKKLVINWVIENLRIRSPTLLPPLPKLRKPNYSITQFPSDSSARSRAGPRGKSGPGGFQSPGFDCLELLRAFSNSSPGCHPASSAWPATCQPRANPSFASLALPVKSMSGEYSSEGW